MSETVICCHCIHYNIIDEFEIECSIDDNEDSDTVGVCRYYEEKKYNWNNLETNK